MEYIVPINSVAIVYSFIIKRNNDEHRFRFYNQFVATYGNICISTALLQNGSVLAWQ